MLITKKFIAFYDFVYFVPVVSRQFISFVTKMEVVGVARITSSRSQWNVVLTCYEHPKRSY